MQNWQKRMIIDKVFWLDEHIEQSKSNLMMALSSNDKEPCSAYATQIAIASALAEKNGILYTLSVFGYDLNYTDKGMEIVEHIPKEFEK